MNLVTQHRIILLDKTKRSYPPLSFHFDQRMCPHTLLLWPNDVSSANRISRSVFIDVKNFDYQGNTLKMVCETAISPESFKFNFLGRAAARSPVVAPTGTAVQNVCSLGGVHRHHYIPHNPAGDPAYSQTFWHTLTPLAFHKKYFVCFREKLRPSFEMQIRTTRHT